MVDDDSRRNTETDRPESRLERHSHRAASSDDDAMREEKQLIQNNLSQSEFEFLTSPKPESKIYKGLSSLVVRI